jgi:uncharacterized membrane protein YfcA
MDRFFSHIAAGLAWADPPPAPRSSHRAGRWLWQATGALPAALPVWLAVVAVGALVGTQLGIHRLPLKGLRYALSLVLLIAAAKLLLG